MSSPHTARDELEVDSLGRSGGAVREISQCKRGATSWTELLIPNHLGDISTFLNTGDLCNLLLTAGTEARAVIKKKYLRHNYWYLEKFVLTETNKYFPSLTFSNSKINDWMRSNGNSWKDLYENANILSKSERLIFTVYFGNTIGAVRLGSVDVLKYLIEKRGADPSAEVPVGNYRRSRLVLAAACHPNPGCLHYLLEGGGIVSYASVDALELILENGVDVNAPIGQYRHTLAHEICRSLIAGDQNDAEHTLRRMRLILEHGADLSIPDSRGSTLGENPEGSATNDSIRVGRPAEQYRGGGDRYLMPFSSFRRKVRR